MTVSPCAPQYSPDGRASIPAPEHRGILYVIKYAVTKVYFAHSSLSFAPSGMKLISMGIIGSSQCVHIKNCLLGCSIHVL